MYKNIISAILIIVFGLAIISCGPNKKNVPIMSSPPLIPGSIQSTPLGTLVYVPLWLDRDQNLKNEALAEIDSSGIPAGIVVFIQDPGMYSWPPSPTGLAYGHTDMNTYIYVAWRTNGSYPLLPALIHEVNHVITKDPNFGH